MTDHLTHLKKEQLFVKPTKLDSLYPLQKKDAPRAAVVLADAFQRDPVWKAVLSDGKPEQRRAAFEAPVRYCLKYGEVYAPSPALEGVAAWLPGAVADMTPWRMLLSGAMWPGMRMGMDAAKKMMPIFRPIEADRKAMMRGKEFIYLLVIGVDPRFQGQGVGGRLLRALFEKSERDRVPIYLETQTEDNVRLYEHLGFHVIKEVVLPVVHLPMWEMVRDVSPSAR